MRPGRPAAARPPSTATPTPPRSRSRPCSRSATTPASRPPSPTRSRSCKRTGERRDERQHRRPLRPGAARRRRDRRCRRERGEGQGASSSPPPGPTPARSCSTPTPRRRPPGSTIAPADLSQAWRATAQGVLALELPSYGPVVAPPTTTSTTAASTTSTTAASTTSSTAAGASTTAKAAGDLGHHPEDRLVDARRGVHRPVPRGPRPRRRRPVAPPRPRLVVIVTGAVRGGRRLRAAPVLLLLAGLLAWGPSPTPAGAAAAASGSPCSDPTGITVVVDFHDLGGGRRGGLRGPAGELRLRRPGEGRLRTARTSNRNPARCAASTDQPDRSCSADAADQRVLGLLVLAARRDAGATPRRAREPEAAAGHGRGLGVLAGTRRSRRPASPTTARRRRSPAPRRRR